MKKSNLRSNTITRNELALAVYKSVPTSRQEAKHIVDAVIEHLVHAIATDGTVKVHNFGTFEVYSN